jgi:6-phosphogluconolactonase
MRVERYESASSLQYNAASAIVRFLNEAIAMRGSASLVLSGGSTPKAVYEMIAAEPASVPWKNVRLFWGDERCVPPTHPDSNYRMTRDALLSRIAIPDQNIFRIEAELEPRRAAENYAAVMRNEFRLTDGDIPRFDVVMLGLGEDGHTASLFPGTTILDESRKIVAEVFVPKFNAHRISMTFPAINNARTLLFLVSGSGKAGILRAVLEKEPNNYPAQRVKPTHGSLYWLVDAAAAANLQSTTFHQHFSLLT